MAGVRARVAAAAVLAFAQTGRAGAEAAADAAEVGASPVVAARREIGGLAYEWGPRAQLGVGFAAAGRGPEVRPSVAVFAGLADARARALWPTETGRVQITSGLMWRVDGASPVGLWVGGGLGWEEAFLVGGLGAESYLDPAEAGDVPFGGGGTWTSFATTLGPAPRLFVDIDARVYFGGWPLVFGARAASNAYANTAHEGLAAAPSIEVRWTGPTARGVAAGLALLGVVAFPHDASADVRGLVRGVAGITAPRRRAPPFVFTALEVGSGPGLLINRNELRWSVGVRVVHH